MFSNMLSTRSLQLIMILTCIIPKIASLECHQSYTGMNTSLPSFCTGHLCAITFSSTNLQVQSCIVNVFITTGCIGSFLTRILCICDTDRCNSISFNPTPSAVTLTSFTTARCPEQSVTGTLSRASCNYTNNTSRNLFHMYDQPDFFYSLYQDGIFIDQSSRNEMNETNKRAVFPTSSLLAFCHNGECEDQYKVERDRNYTRNAQLAVACYTNSHESSDNIFVCYGHACYVNHFNGTTTRGCFDYIFDTKWADGTTHFQYLLEDRRVEKITIHQFLLLEFYFCSYDYCNQDNVGAKKMSSSSFHYIRILNVMIIAISVIMKTC